MTSLNSNPQLTVNNNTIPTHSFKRMFKPGRLSLPRDFDRIQPRIYDMLNSTKPLILEIGAGKGRHACQFAVAHSGYNLIAIERTKEKFAAFAKRIGTLKQQGQNINNLLAIHADAIPFVVHALPPRCLATIYILYPNPEKNNPNQQWLNMPFFEFLLSRLQPTGRIVLASNVRDYIEHAHKQAIETWQLPTVRYHVEVSSQRTHFEIKYLARGEVCEELVITKPEAYRTRFD